MDKLMTDEATTLHQEAVVVDGHCDTLLGICDDGLFGMMKKATNQPERSLSGPRDVGHLDLPRLREGGVDAQFFACYTPPFYKPDRGMESVLLLIDTFYRELEAHGDAIGLALSVDDILTLKNEGKVAAILAIEGAEAIGTELANLRILYRLGVRSIGLTWNERNTIADGVGESRSGGGLTRFGVDVVKEMNRLGLLIDVSHLSEASFWQVLEETSQPVVATHSNAIAISNHPRNLTDDQLKALRDNGGVTGINFAKGILDPDHTSLDRVLDHIDYIIDLIGVEHVGIGSDYDGIGVTPEHLEDCSKYPNITGGLLSRGYSHEDIKGILGGNFLRVMRGVMG